MLSRLGALLGAGAGGGATDEPNGATTNGANGVSGNANSSSSGGNGEANEQHSSSSSFDSSASASLSSANGSAFPSVTIDGPVSVDSRPASSSSSSSMTMPTRPSLHSSNSATSIRTTASGGTVMDVPQRPSLGRRFHSFQVTRPEDDAGPASGPGSTASPQRMGGDPRGLKNSGASTPGGSGGGGSGSGSSSSSNVVTFPRRRRSISPVGTVSPSNNSRGVGLKDYYLAGRSKRRDSSSSSSSSSSEDEAPRSRRGNGGAAPARTSAVAAPAPAAAAAADPSPAAAEASSPTSPTSPTSTLPGDEATSSVAGTDATAGRTGSEIFPGVSETIVDDETPPPAVNGGKSNASTNGSESTLAASASTESVSGTGKSTPAAAASSSSSTKVATRPASAPVVPLKPEPPTRPSTLPGSPGAAKGGPLARTQAAAGVKPGRPTSIPTPAPPSGSPQPSMPLTPGRRERLEWQAMLSSVLNGDVIRSEKQRLGSTDSTRKRGDPEERYAIWLGIKAATSGRRLEDEKRFLEEFRKTEVDKILEEVVRFEVKEGPDMPTAYDQVVSILDKVELVESLYQSHRAITTEKPIYASLSFQYNLDALVSWLSITSSLKMQLQILKNWTGSETLTISVAGDRSFIERILKESGVKGTFERRIMSVLKGMVRRTKQAMTTNAAAFRRMRLPTHIEELRLLAQFPSNLLEEFLKLRLEYTENLIKPVGTGGLGAIAELVEDSSISLGLAARIKEETLDLDTPADGWTITNSLSTTYDSVFLASLRFYFRLLNWRLKSSAEIVFFKEVEMLENEWEFLTEQVAPWLEGGDVEIAEQFCKLEEELLRKVNSYFQAQMSVAPGSLTSQSSSGIDGESSNSLAVPSPFINNPQANVARWYKSRVLENVRARSRKLLRFMKSLISEFELASEYLLIGLEDLISKLQASGHILVDVTGTGKGVTPQGYLVFASPSLQDRPTVIKKLLRACLTRYESFREDVGDGYVLVVSPGRDKHITWRGGKVMKLNDPASAKGYRLKPERVRLVADNGEVLPECRRLFEAVAGPVCVKLKKESRAHVFSVLMAIKGVKRTLFNLTEVVIGSVRVVRDMIRKMNFARTSDMGSVHDLIQEWFTFASDFGNKALRHVGGTTRRKTLQKSFVRLGIEWLDFVVVDCVSTDKRTYRWSLVALEFAMKLNTGNGIFDLTDEEFSMFKFQVARCMSLLISHVDVQGTRQFALSASAKLEAERQTGATSELIRSEIARLLEGHVDLSHEEGVVTAVDEVEEERQRRQRGMRIIGKVLDDRNIEERNIGLLASSSSSISLRWQQGKFLGGGSYGSVYMAINLDSGDVMAVKEIKFQDVSSLEALKRSIKEEMTVMQMLHHPHIVNYYGVEVHRDKLYIFMEYCPNSLAGLLEHGRIEDENVIRIYAKQMLLGLEYLHSKNIVHRDVKPANTLIDSHGGIKFVDFGASKVYKNQKTLVVNGEHNSLIGTPHYMSPEVITGEQIADMKKGSQDIWSLGCCVLEMVTGRKPWVNLDNEWAIMYHIGISGRHPPLPDSSQLSEAGIDFLTLCFARPAKARPSASELLEHEWIKDVDENALYTEYPSGSPSAPLDSAGLLTSSTSSTSSPFFQRTQSGGSLQLGLTE